MLRVLTLSTLFPNATAPNFGVFVERQTVALAARHSVEVRVVAPLGMPPLLGRHPRWHALTTLPEHELWSGLDVRRPRFPIVPVVGGRLMPALLARRLLPLLREVRREFAFDVIDAEFFYPDGPAAVRLGRALGVPVSIKARGADIHYWRKVARRQVLAAGRAAGGMLAVSAALRADMTALGLPRERIRVHHTGVDLARFVPIDRAVAKAALGVNGTLLVTVGHLIARKGQRHAIEALAQLPDATLIIAGDGENRVSLESLVARLGLVGRVRFVGNVAHDALPALLAAADVMVLPTASEGLANVWVEALACGTPVVTCDVGGAREIIDRPAAGRLVARNADAVAAGVRALLANPPAPADTRAAALGFTWEANAAALEAHLRMVASAAAM